MGLGLVLLKSRKNAVLVDIYSIRAVEKAVLTLSK
jgi:hypothetical protein